jgi:pilus assembly protein TadC
MERERETMANVPILIFPAGWTKIFRFLVPYARILLPKKKREDIEAAGIEMEPEQYIIASFFSSLIWGLLVFLLILIVQLYSVTRIEDAYTTPSMIFVLMFFVFFILHYIYPSILSRKVADVTDRLLLNVMRDMWVQSTSGVMLYGILQNIARADYGSVSKDLQIVVREISAGEREAAALEKAASLTRSESFRRILWHIIASMRTGIGLSAALESAVNTLAADQRRAIGEYGSSLNFYLLMYLLFAAVVPAILITFLSLLSIFGVFSLSIELLAAMVVGFVFIQFTIIGFMRVSRPEIA